MLAGFPSIHRCPSIDDDAAAAAGRFESDVRAALARVAPQRSAALEAAAAACYRLALATGTTLAWARLAFAVQAVLRAAVAAPPDAGDGERAARARLELFLAENPDLVDAPPVPSRSGVGGD